MTIIITSLLLLGSLLPHLTFTAHVNVGIVNGKEAEPHSRPYMVSIQMYLYGHKHKCGGFLISEEFVLTAAHCQNKNLKAEVKMNVSINRKEELTVVVGAHDRRKTNEGADRIKVNSYYRHPNYSENPYRNDIMLLRLEKKVEMNKNVKWISIPKTEGDIAADSDCSVAGWGSLVTNGSASPVLMETNVTIMNNNKCENIWKSEFSAAQMMCVYGKGGTCDGDSGGPLVCGDTAVGITSFGDPQLCNSPKLPEVYTKISAFLQWIKKIIKN